MATVTIEKMGTKWKVRRDGDVVGVYKTDTEAKKIAEVAKYADTWPPESGIAGIRFTAGKWAVDIGSNKKRTVSLDEAIRWKRAHGKAVKEKKEKTRNAGCAKCAWRLMEQTGTAGKHYHCGYSLCYGHHSRVWLHYQRTGRESLEGMTFGENCTEFLAGNPEDKKTLLQDNVSRISEKAWKLLAKEFGEDQRKTEKKVKETRSRTDMVEMDMDKATELRGKHTWREIAETVGMTVNGAKGCWERQRIKRIAAQRLKDAYGVDIAKTHE